MSEIRRLVLVGLPGAGKTTVGRLVAERIGWDFVDFDDEIMRRTGRSVEDVFQTDGESSFRAMERELTAELCSRSELVMAPGGGWAAQPGLMESMPEGTASVWLEVAPEEAIVHLRGSPIVRPLLNGPDPLAALGALAEQRTERYARADLTVTVNGRSAEDVARTIIEWLRPGT